MSDPGCERFRELASTFVDERLEGAELLAFEGHIESCAGCRRFEAELRRFHQLLRAAASVQPLRRPPAGFAAGVVARLARERAPVAVPFPPPRRGRRALRALAGLAAAAAAALFFAWSWQRLLPAGEAEQRIVHNVAAPSPWRPDGPEEGNLDAWVRQHAVIARDATILGSAEEVEFASFHPDGRGR